MAFIHDESVWAEAYFGECDLGDRRRTKRLVQLAATQAASPEAAVNALCGGDPAFREGAYRLLNNESVEAEDITESIFSRTVDDCAERKVVLSIQDTTSVSFTHGPKEELGELTTKVSTNRGLLAHSTLAVDGDSGDVIGLLDQARWVRPKKRPGRDKRKSIPYEKKESYKWELATRRAIGRIGDPTRFVVVADREADVYEYLRYLDSVDHGAVIRACYDRNVMAQEGHLWKHLKGQPIVGSYELYIEQRGAMYGSKHHATRPAREGRWATLDIQTAEVTLVPSRSPKSSSDKHLKVTAVYVRERDETAPTKSKPIEWMLLTFEQVDSIDDALRIIGYYEKRWLVEEFHKCWKTGCRQEERSHQSRGAMERGMVILAAIGVRLLQLKTIAEQNPEAPAESVFTEEEVACLKDLTRQRQNTVPRRPTVEWVYYEIGKLAGWTDTKQTGRVGWITLWRGLEKFQAIHAGWALARESAGAKK